MPNSMYDLLANGEIFGAVEAAGKWIAKSGLVGAKSEADGVVIAMTCAQEDISPVQFSRVYHIVNGKLSMRGDAMLSAFKLRGGKVEWVERSDTRCIAKFSLDGQCIEERFTIEDAKRIGLAGRETWKSYPKNMLTWRVVANAIRLICPDIVCGIYTPEEVEEFTETKPAEAKPVQSLFPERNRELAESYVELREKIEQEKAEGKDEDKKAKDTIWPRLPNDGKPHKDNGHVESSTEPIDQPLTSTELWEKLVSEREIVEQYLRSPGLKWLAVGQTLDDLLPRYKQRAIKGAEKLLEVARKYEDEAGEK